MDKRRNLTGIRLVLVSLLLVLISSLSLVPIASASPDTTIDFLTNVTANGIYGRFGGTGQVFTVPATDTVLQSFSFGINQTAGATVTGRLYSWNGQHATGSALYQGTATVSSQTVDVNKIYHLLTFNTGRINLAAGSQYVFLVLGNSFVAYLGDKGSVYSGGFLAIPNNADQSQWTTSNWLLYTIFDLAFRATFVSPRPSILPTDFNVLSLGNLTIISTEVEGITGAVDNASFNGTNLATRNPVRNALFVNGNTAFNSWGNTVHGDAIIGGSVNPRFVTFSPGHIVPTAALSSSLGSFTRAVSDAWAGLPPNGVTEVKPWGQIILTGRYASRNVFRVPGEALSSTNSLVVNAPAGSTVIVNVTGSGPARLQYMGIQLNGVDRQHIIYNFSQASALTINGVGVEGSIWAVRAAVTFTNAQIRGTLVGSSVVVNSGRYENYPFLPALPPV